mmetsp:Transcript_15241/g.33368  ORF Transcript_15241/g.33368 Transcript_15241/m.33368 type:complete len:219 (-) Transcript_15241:856-1512(-)
MSSRPSWFFSQTSNTRSYAAAKFVLSPHGALCSLRTLSTIVSPSNKRNHSGWRLKVMTILRKDSWVISEMPIPRAIATSMGVPVMEPLTSQRGTILVGSKCKPSSAPLALTSFTIPAHKSFHCASRASVIPGLMFGFFMIVATISWGKTWLPLSPFSTMESRKMSRSRIRLASSDRSVPFLVSFRNARDKSLVALLATLEISISSARWAANRTSGSAK